MTSQGIYSQAMSSAGTHAWWFTVVYKPDSAIDVGFLFFREGLVCARRVLNRDSPRGRRATFLTVLGGRRYTQSDETPRTRMGTVRTGHQFLLACIRKAETKR